MHNIGRHLRALRGLALAALWLSVLVPGAAAETKPSKKEQAAAGALPQAAPAEPDSPSASPSFKETLAAVGQISRELKSIDERLGKLEQSVAGVNASLEPVGGLAQPATLRSLILLATACGAGLIVLGAVLRRWSQSPPRR